MAGTEGMESSRRAFLRWLSLSGVGLAAGALPAALAPSGQAAADTPDSTDITVITHGTVIDGTGGSPRRDATVVLIGDRIVGVAGHGEIPVPAGVRIVDARGKFVIPGLWDTHTHGLELDTIYPALHIANGVTGIRVMWGYSDVWPVRDRINSGELLGPRIVMGSGVIDGPITLLTPPVIKVGTPAEAREAVRQELSTGAEFIKVYSNLSREALAAIAAESRARGVPFGGHVAWRVSSTDASDLGQRSFEHMFGVPVSTSRNEAEFRKIIADTPLDPANPRAFFNTMRELELQASSTYHPPTAAAFYDRLVRNGSWQSPTLRVNVVMSSPAGTFDDDVPLAKYTPAWLREFWLSRHALFAPQTPEQIARHREFTRARLRMVGAMHRAGVGVLGGTDCLNPFCYPGFGLHDELAVLVEAGLTPMQALQVATIDSARYLGLERTMGTITPGKVADLVVVDADPLADIRNARKVHAVVTRGRLITRAQREQLLLDAEKAAAESTPQAAAAQWLRAAAAGGCC